MGTHFPLIISPASGIRRPSYNGAPAMQGTLGFPKTKAITSALSRPALSSALFSLSLFEKFNRNAPQRAPGALTRAARKREKQMLDVRY